MSVLITPLPNDDAIIMTGSLTCYLHDIVYMIFEERNATICFISTCERGYYEFLCDYDIFTVINSKLSDLNLIYYCNEGNICFPKTNITYAYKKDTKISCVLLKRFTVRISNKTFIKIQEDIMLKHVQTIEREELERENKMMRAHIEFSPGGQEFFKVMESFKNKQK
jgi:hypothetical protein